MKKSQLFGTLPPSYFMEAENLGEYIQSEVLVVFLNLIHNFAFSYGSVVGFGAERYLGKNPYGDWDCREPR